jgi:small multidrug resistance family-3 protein
LGASLLRPKVPAVDILRSVGLFGTAAIAEIGGAYLIWQAIREGGAWWLALLGGLALFAYGYVATLQSDPHFGRILAAYGGVFVAGSLAWGVVFDDFRPERWDIAGATISLVGVAVIMYAPRGG